MTLERPTATPLRIMRNTAATQLASLTATLSTWSGLSTMQALQLWRRVFREPTHSNKIFHSLLLMKIHGEQRTTDFLQRATVMMGVAFFVLSLTIATLMAYDRDADRKAGVSAVKAAASGLRYLY